MRKQIAHIVQRIWQSATQRVMSITVLGMAMSLLVDLFIATRLGATAEADALIIALTLPRLIEITAREGTRFSLLTTFVDAKERLTTNKFERFVSSLLNLFLAAGGILVVLGWILAPVAMSLMAPGLSEAARIEATQLFRYAIPLTIFALGSTVLEAFLNSLAHFMAASVRNAVISTIVVVGIMLAWHGQQMPMWTIVGYTVGYCLFFLWLLRYTLVRIDFQYHWKAWPGRDDFTNFWRAIFYPTAGLSVRQGSRIVENALASLVAPGGVSAYYFAFRLISAAQTIVGVSIATTGLPRIAQYALDGDREKFARALRSQITKVVAVSLPVVVMIMLFGRQIVGLLFGRGEVTAESIQTITQIVKYLSVSLVFWSIVSILNSALFALQKYSWTLYNIIVNTVVHLLLAWLLSFRWGLVGLAVATTFLTALRAVSTNALIHYALKQEHLEVKAEGR